MFFLFQDIKQSKARDPYLQLAIDEALCLHLAKQKRFRGGFRLWETKPSVILGRTCDPQRTLCLHNTSALSFAVKHKRTRAFYCGLPLCRRLSGGGTVLHGLGNWNYSIFLSLEAYPRMFSIEHSYRGLLGIIQSVLKMQDIDAVLAGQSDIALARPNGSLGKISGNAQFRRGGILVLHGTLIVKKEFLSQISVYLAHPPKEPIYRERRKHLDFMSHLPEAFDLFEFYQSLQKALGQFFETKEFIFLSSDERNWIYFLALRLAREFYMQKEWIVEAKRLV